MPEYLQSKPLVVAITLSLGVHVLLLMPWRHGDWLGKNSYYSGQTVTSAPPRLDALLKQAAPSAPVPAQAVAAEPPPPATPQEKTVSPAPQQPEAAASEKPAGIPLDALYYYAVKELDQRPSLTKAPQFDAATGGPSLMVSGSAVLELLIENNGYINAVNVVHSDLPESYLQPLREAFSAVRYSPGRKEERQVRSRLYVEVAYRDGMFSGMSADTYTVVPPIPMGSPKASRERKKNPPPRN